MTEGDVLVFVEVRFRADSQYGSGFETVDDNKQRKLLICAEQFLAGHPAHQDSDCRFDVVSITLDALERPNIEWIKDAF